MAEQVLSSSVGEYFARDDAAAQWWGITTETQGRYGKQLAFLERHADPQGKDVLDVATGQGRFAIRSALRGAASVRAIDISSKMIEQAQVNATKCGAREMIEFCVGDVADLDLEAKQFDIISLMEVLVHLPAPRSHLEKLVGSLKPGGVLVTNYDYPFAPAINYQIDSLRAIVRGFLRGSFRRTVVMHDTVEQTINELDRQRVIDGPKQIVMRPRDAYRGIGKRAVRQWLRELGLSVVGSYREHTRIARLPIPVPIGEMLIARKDTRAVDDK
jgi:ubiquinone/menaquinone biosynthesis C-methylase UbiE